MFTIYSKHKDSNSWLFDGHYETASEAVRVARLLHKHGYQVEIDDGLTVEKDSPYND